MANVRVNMGNLGVTPRGLMVFFGVLRTEKITSSSSVTSGTLVAEKGNVAIAWADGAVIVRGDGDADQDNGIFVPANSYSVPIYVEAGQSLTVIDAT